MKRKADETDSAVSNGQGKRPALDTEENASLRSRFRDGLFDSETISQYTKDYASSGPYKHAVVSDLINDSLLRSVRKEIVDNIHFTPKETDIYKIHQSGDLANLDGLPEEALQKLPSLLRLRDALYGKEFRQWISEVSGAGNVSGKKTDMAVNVYVPGCHLLCHDDVIGSRRVSYILYLTDPDKPWKAEWGGALRLYPTDERRSKEGKSYKVPTPDWTKVIPPAWNQLSFFAVQPGESFHDVEEVYKGLDQMEEEDGGRIRMAISGWFHIPQEGEEGYEPGLEARMAEKSSLQQLQGKADEFDLPQPAWFNTSLDTSEGVDELTEQDLEFLLQFMTPNYLTPDTVEDLNDIFQEESTLQLTAFLNDKFAPRLKDQLVDVPEEQSLVSRPFKVSGPPYKHRYQYVQAQPGLSSTSPFQRVLDELLPSTAFSKWLALVTGLTLGRANVMARRFRRGVDYQLAQSYEGDDPQLEYTISITASSGWSGNDTRQSDAEGGEDTAGTTGQNAEDDDNTGGYELYMAGDDPDDDEDEASEDGMSIPTNVQSHTGAGDRRSAKRKKADPAVYQAAADDEDDGILFTNPPTWNTMSIVLRDKGTLKFVKYVSRSAAGDRFDLTGNVEVEDDIE